MIWSRVSDRSSWHVTNEAKPWLTLCGRRTTGEEKPACPDGAKSCESCLRLVAKRGIS